MPRNHLKGFPTAILRRGMVHFHPGATAPGPNLAARRPEAPAETEAHRAPAGSTDPPAAETERRA